MNKDYATEGDAGSYTVVSYRNGGETRWTYRTKEAAERALARKVERGERILRVEVPFKVPTRVGYEILT